MHGAYLGGMGVLLVAPLPALLSDCRPPSSHITRQEALPAAGFVAMDASLLATGAGGTKLDVQAQAMTLSHWLLVKQLGQGNTPPAGRVCSTVKAGPRRVALLGALVAMGASSCARRLAEYSVWLATSDH